MEQVKAPKLRFQQFTDTWELKHPNEIFRDISDKGHPELEVLTIRQGYGTVARKDSGIDISFNEETRSNYKRVDKGDFIIHLRSFQGGLEMARSEGILSPAYTVLRYKEPIATGFYQQYFHTNRFINQELRKSVEGIRDGRQISYRQFSVARIPYPSLPEQREMAAFFTSLDHRIALADKKLATLQTIKKGMLQKIFSQELRFKDDDGNEFPAWEKSRLYEICDFEKGRGLSRDDLVDDGTRKCVLYGQLFTDYGWFIDEVKSKTNSDEKDIKISESGDILIPRCSTAPEGIGRASLMMESGVILGFDINILKVMDKKRLLPSFLTLAINYHQKDLQKKVVGAMVRHLENKEIKNVSVEYPTSAKEQQKIAAYFTNLDRSIAAAQKKADALRTIKKGLLQKMFI